MTDKDFTEAPKKENENIIGLTKKEIDLQKRLLKAEEALKTKELENEALQKSIQEQDSEKTSSDELSQLKAQVDILSRQVVRGAAGEKIKFREPTAADLVPEGEEVTFISRHILYIVASYRDYRGIEQLPPHKLIVFQYAASDIRKEGKEDVVLNYSQYTTNLKTEIEFLRNHPFYNISFSESTNEIMDADAIDTQYKVRAATALQHLPPEEIYRRAAEYKIPNYQKKHAQELRLLIVNRMAQLFKAEQKELHDEQARKRAMGMIKVNEEK